MKAYFASLLACMIFFSCQEAGKNAEKKLYDKLFPFEDHFFDKQYPNTSFHIEAYFDALREVHQFKGNIANRTAGSWVVEGPGNIGARINTIAVQPGNPSVILVGFSEGGIFKTTNGGINWVSVFDDQVKLSIGDIAFDPENPNVVYAGTGDPNISGFPFVGNGLFKSTDAGNSWTYSGLSEVGIISQIRFSPSNSNILYVGAMGIPFIKNEHRGLYKSVNGGASWEKVLYVNDSTGIIDLAIHPVNGDVVYATSWNRIRNNNKSLVSGPDGKIFKTTNGGQSWQVLGGGLPEGRVSRVGIDISKSNPDILYSCFTHQSTYNLEAIFKSTDGGTNWTSLPIYDSQFTSLPRSLYGGFGWYFGKIRINPFNPDDVFILGVDMFRSKDGGINWEQASPPWWTYEVHADKHDLVFSGDEILLATDGGLYKSFVENTEVWKDIENIPATQFYRVAVNPHQTELYYGGAQDNGSTGGNAPTINEWDRIYGGDGFQMAFPKDSSHIFYAETQNGNIVVTQDGGESFDGGSEGIESSEPRNWDMPYFISAFSPRRLYTGTNRMYRTDSTVVPGWIPISPVLTDSLSLAFRKNISSLHESPVDQRYLYAGTSDGMLWHSPDYGNNWHQIMQGLPRHYITSIQASPEDRERVFVSFSGYRNNDNTPYIFMSSDRGQQWKSIQGNLPQIAINSILVLPGHESKVIFVATDAGVFYTINQGVSWQFLGDNMPMVAVYHLAYNPMTNKLVAGTYGRSIQSFDLGQVNLISSIKKQVVFYEFSIRPNITAGKTVVIINNEQRVLPEAGYVMNQSGAIISTFKVDAEEMEFDFSFLPPGQYFISLYSSSGVASKTFFKT